MQDDKKIIKKVFYDLKKFKVKNYDSYANVFIEEFEKIKKSHMLSNTAIDAMHLINSFGKRHNLKKEVKVHMADDSLQMIDKDTCIKALFLCKSISPFPK